MRMLRGKGYLVIILLIISIISGCAGLKEGVSSLISGTKDAMSGMEKMAEMGPVLEFSMVYSTSVYGGGYAFEGESYKEGQGTVWLVENKDQDRVYSYELERALLKNLPDGLQWWQLRYKDEQGSKLYEYLIDADYNIHKIRFIHPESGEIVEYIPEEQAEGNAQADQTSEVESISEEDYAGLNRGKQTVTVKAGTFVTDHLVTEAVEGAEEQYVFEWWLTRKVPGGSVKYQGTNQQDNSQMRGELVKIKSGYVTELNSF